MVNAIGLLSLVLAQTPPALVWENCVEAATDTQSVVMFSPSFPQTGFIHIVVYREDDDEVNSVATVTVNGTQIDTFSSWQVVHVTGVGQASLHVATDSFVSNGPINVIVSLSRKPVLGLRTMAVYVRAFAFDYTYLMSGFSMPTIGSSALASTRYTSSNPNSLSMSYVLVGPAVATTSSMPFNLLSRCGKINVSQGTVPSGAGASTHTLSSAADWVTMGATHSYSGARAYIVSWPNSPNVIMPTGSGDIVFWAFGAAPLEVECRLNGVPSNPCTSPYTFSGLVDGDHVFELVVTDSLGLNAFPYPATLAFTVNTSLPDTVITSGPSGTVTSRSAQFSFTSTEAGTFRCSLDGIIATLCSSPLSYAALADGAHTFTVYAVDSAGSADPTPASASWLIDATAPQTTLTSTPPQVAQNTSANFGFSSNEPGVFTCRVDLADSFCTPPLALSGLTDGMHTFQAWATDSAGNPDQTPATYTWAVDLTAPDTTLTVTTNATASTATLTFSSNEAGSAFECRLDSATFFTCASPFDLTGLADGAHHLEVRAIDAAGRPDPSPATHDLITDTTAPDTTWLLVPASQVALAEVKFEFASETNAAFGCSLDGAVFAPCASPQTRIVSEGAHIFAVRATDDRGNTDSTPATHSWTYADARDGSTGADDAGGDDAGADDAGADDAGADDAGETLDASTGWSDGGVQRRRDMAVGCNCQSFEGSVWGVIVSLVLVGLRKVPRLRVLA